MYVYSIRCLSICIYFYKLQRQYILTCQKIWFWVIRKPLVATLPWNSTDFTSCVLISCVSADTQVTSTLYNKGDGMNQNLSRRFLTSSVIYATSVSCASASKRVPYTIRCETLNHDFCYVSEVCSAISNDIGQNSKISINNQTLNLTISEIIMTVFC